MKHLSLWTDIKTAYAQELINCSDGTQADPTIGCVNAPGALVRSETSLTELILTGSNHFMTIVAAVAVIMLMVAAIQYALAAGDGEKINRSKRNMFWSVLGLGIAILAKVGVKFILGGIS